MRPILRSVLRPILFCAIGILSCRASVQAADWLTVASDRVRRVELDRASILPSDAGTKVAWGRIVLSNEQAKAYGYRTVRALNRYDCRSHAFIIVKRVYLSDDDTTLREDKVDAIIPITVKAGTVDDRFFNEVCKPASLNDLRNTAQQATDRLASIGEADREKEKLDKDRLMLRRADIRLTTDEPPVQSAPPKAADKTPAKPQEKASAAKPEAHAAAPEHKTPAEPMATHTSTSSMEKHTTVQHAAEHAASSSAAASAAASSGRRSPADQQAAERAAEQASHQVAAMTAHKQATAASSAAPRKLNAMQAAMALVEKTKAAAPTMTSDGHDLHWSYEGADGPENWGKLDPEFSVCTNGKRQSPIDIHDGIKVDQEPIQFDYKPSYFRIVDNGHTIQVTYGAGSHITVMGRTYELVQLHFHHPAEERIDGKGFDMVAHLVHRDAEGRLAIVAILLQAGQANRFIQTLWNNLPLEKNEDYAPQLAIQMNDLLPGRRDYISYIGSLTTPPCTEGVLWLVMKAPVELSTEQIDVFTRFYPNNARPVQASAGRVIKESR
ncbi:MAG: eukaryotic-type carbonic anhydrase family protein [Rhodocyclales bacterium]|nr:eukaryotic-type carbonic anhydrase family protein [Rhodocyclales bacterium]